MNLNLNLKLGYMKIVFWSLSLEKKKNDAHPMGHLYRDQAKLGVT
jgi:hypothetical protein